MAKQRTYSALKNTVLLNGLIKLIGWNKFTIKPPKKRWKQESDATGGQIFIEEPGWLETVVSFDVDQTGEANDYFTGFFISGDTVAFTAKDDNGLSFLQMKGKINHDGSSYGKDAENKTWEIVGFVQIQLIMGNTLS